MTGIPPWQVAYDQFRQLYPTGGLLLDLVATPTPDFAQYVVKATAQVGNLTLLSVLGEASNLLGAETQACQKLFQVLKLAELSPAAFSASALAAPPPLDLQVSVAPPPEPFTPVSPPASAALDKEDRSAGMNSKTSLPPQSAPIVCPSPSAGKKLWLRRWMIGRKNWRKLTRKLNAWAGLLSKNLSIYRSGMVN
ncbi:MAG: hypothetical protein ACO3NK_06480 [Prochlorotrichaceae cyanobacterium]